MNKVWLIACLALSIAANAQTAPKVVFIGDDFTYLWQTTPQFTANKNWTGAAIPATNPGGGSGQVLEIFQTAVINRHPAFVQIMVGGSDIGNVNGFSNPLGYVWQQWEQNLAQMVEMAQKADIKVILGNITSSPGIPNPNPAATQFLNTWLADYGQANNIPVVNYHDALCECVGSTSPNDTFAIPLSVQPPNPDEASSTPNASGYALITQMAQIAIQTYGLTIKGGYLSNVIPNNEFNPGSEPPLTQQNDVSAGQVVDFTPQATWSDGVTRPVLNSDYNGLKGVWTSSNPKVMYVNQQGQAFAYTAGTTTISFKTESGIPFSPWIMTVQTVLP
jgi:hypothetical protein